MAAGRNATILHYIQNDQALKSGDLLLIDAGAEHNYFTSDIPYISRKRTLLRSAFGLRHRSSGTGQGAIDAGVVGATKDKVHETAVTTSSKGLRNWLSKAQSSLWNPALQAVLHARHRTLAGNGCARCRFVLCGRETGVYEHGTVTTVEPGLYFGQEEDIPEEFRGIGIRIEDDILTTQDGPVVNGCGTNGP